MAKIEMDMSEYEAMKKVETNLQASLDNERELRHQIDKLQQEKMQALEDAKHKVVVETIETKEEVIMKAIPIATMLSSGRVDTMSFLYGLERAVNDIKTGQTTPEEFLDRFVSKYFKKHEMKSGPTKTYTYSQSIKDLENEIQTRLEEGMDKEYKDTLEFSNKCIMENRELKDEIESARAYNDKLKEDLDEVNAQLNEASDKLLIERNITEALQEKIAKVKNMLDAVKFGWFGNRVKIDNIRNFLK